MLPHEQAVVIGDSALKLGLESSALQSALHTGSPRGRQRALLALASMDGATESVGETRTRLLIERLGFPRPVSQFEIATTAGVYRADYAWPQFFVVIEFDGGIKYGLGPTGEVLLAERRRESLLMEQGWVFVRLRWADLNRPEEVRHRIETAIATAARRSA
jgi:very-short-patch-repair endonuclease